MKKTKTINNEKPSWLDDFTDKDVKDVARMNFNNFYKMKESLILKRRSLCSTEDMAKELGCPLSEVIEFEKYYSDPTLSEVQEYAIAVMQEIEINISDYQKTGNGEK